MTWVKFDDQFPIHRKVKGLTDAEYRLHTEAVFWCARNLTDGHVGRDELRDVSGISKPERHLAALVKRGLWIETDTGWVIHDYLEYQPSRSKVLQTRKQRAEAGKLGGKRSGETRNGTKPPRRGVSKTAGQSTSGSKNEANGKQVASGSLQPPAPFLLKKEGTERAPASPGGARAPLPPAADPIAEEIPDWRRMPAYGTQRDPSDAQRAVSGAARVRQAHLSVVGARPKAATRDARAELDEATATMPPLVRPQESA